ncbi:Enzymatic polyprotein [Sesamum angolense]|uniref:Enzymatic polyprotein n=1 Tax=Sesamum angolense TaxID=2727404 RepID=A0AAE1T9Q2_9LAMI|nr:Enzymatic polyprotein [Sesamum angolense]
MDFQPSQNNYREEDRLQTSESLSGFFSRMTVSNKTMERIMRQDSNLSPYDGFRIGGIGKVLNQIGLNQRKHHIIYKVSSGEFAIPMEFTGNVMEMQLIPKEEILEELSRLREETAVTMKWIHIGTIEVVIKATFKEGIDSEIHLSIMDRRINNLRDGCLGTMIGNLKKYIEIPRIFKEFAKVMAPDPIRIPKIGGVDIVIKDHPVLDRTMSSRTEFSSRMTFSEDRIIGYKGKEKDLSKVLTPQEIRVDNVKLKCPERWKEIQVIFDITKNENLFPCDDLYHFAPVIGRYGKIAGHEILVQVGRENGTYIDSGSGICTAKPGVFPKEARETLPVIAGRDFSQKIILNTGIREAKIMIGEHLERPGLGQQGLIDSDSVYEESEEEIKNLKEAMQELKMMDISEESQLSLENVKRLIQRNFSENLLAWWDRNKIEATLKIKEECKYEYVRYKPIQMNMEDKKDMQMIIKEHINLGLIEPGISAYSSPGFLEGLVLSEKKATIAVNKIEFLGILIDEAGIELQEHIVEKIRNFPDILKDKKQLQSFLGVLNFAGIFIKDLAKYRKDFRPLLKESESAKWKWEEIHTQRVRELKQAIPQDEDELVVYTDANDYRWAAVLMKRTTTGEEPCRYAGGLFIEQQARVWHINEKEFFAVWKAFKKWPLFLLAKEFTLKIDNTNDSRPVAADSSTACTRPSSDSGETATNESQGVKTSDDSSQPSTSGVKEGEISLRPMTGTSKANTNELSSSSSSAWQVYQRMWEKLISRKGVNPSKTIIETSGKYNRVWMMEGSKPEEVQEWYEFGALASVHTMSPSFPEISKLPE